MELVETHLPEDFKVFMYVKRDNNNQFVFDGAMVVDKDAEECHFAVEGFLCYTPEALGISNDLVWDYIFALRELEAYCDVTIDGDEASFESMPVYKFDKNVINNLKKNIIEKKELVILAVCNALK